MKIEIKTRGKNNLQVNLLEDNQVLYFLGTSAELKLALANKANVVTPIEGKFNAAGQQMVELVEQYEVK